MQLFLFCLLPKLLKLKKKYYTCTWVLFRAGFDILKDKLGLVLSQRLCCSKSYKLNIHLVLYKNSLKLFGIKLNDDQKINQAPLTPNLFKTLLYIQ